MKAGRVRIVTGEPGGALAAAVSGELARAGLAPEIASPELTSPDGLLVFIDDEGLPRALPRLAQLLPGRSTFPNAILVVERPDRAAGLIGEGFRDVVKPADAPAAIDAILRARPPVLLMNLRQEVQGDFLPKFVSEMRQRAQEKQTLIRECMDLVRVAAHLEKRIFRLRRRYERQAIDELLIHESKIESYLDDLGHRRANRLGRLPPFPSGSATGGVLGRREPRFRRAREEINDAIEWLRQAGFLRALGQPAMEAMTETATTLVSKPLQGLGDCLNIIERETALRLSLIDRLQAQVNPIAVLEERCLERYGFGILPPGIAVPESLLLIVRSVIQPPAETYVTWCLDLRDLQLKQCGDVLAEIARDLAWTRAAARPGAEPDRSQRSTGAAGPAHRM